MNVGQQKYVVSYTLKGKEKQPDILNAQKSATEINDTIFKMKTPSVIRPDDLFSSAASSSSSRNLSNLISQNPHNLQKLIDLNSQSYISNNQSSMTSHYSIHPPPYSRDFEASLNFPVTYDFGTGITTTSSQNNATSDGNNLYNCSEGNSSSIKNSKNYYSENKDNSNTCELGQSVVDNGDSNINNCNNDNNRDIEAYDFLSYKANNDINEDFLPDYVNNSVDYKNLANQIANTISNINSTLNRSRNRNHILTENLPGPESCV
jgi:hypothetical protein